MYILGGNEIDTKIDIKSIKCMFNKDQNVTEWTLTME